MIDQEKNMALKLNSQVARALHGKKMDFGDLNNPFSLVANPLVSFRSFYNQS